MYYAIIDSASLENPTVLNTYKHLNVTVQFEPQSTVGKYHYIFLLQFLDSGVEQAIVEIQREMLSSWYSFFWNDTSANILFDTARFVVSLPDGWTSKEAIKAREFGTSQGIQEEYLDFRAQLKPYEDMVKKLTHSI